jgi:glycosyltransferase involved in cell wall biosynthesis
MKIALVAHWDWTLYNFRMPLAHALRERGYDVVFVCPFGEYVSFIRKAGFPVIDWHLQRRSFNPLSEGMAIWHLFQIYRQEALDAVHHFTIKPNIYGSLAAQMARIPKIINTFTGLGFVFADSTASRLLRTIVLPLLRLVLWPRNAMTVFQNDHDREVFMQRGLVRSAQTSVIAGSGVNTTRFAPSSNGRLPNAEPIVLMASRLLMDKGLSEFVGAAQHLREMGIGGRFWVAGTPDEGNPACVPRALLAQWQRDGVVEFLGQRTDMPELLRQADIAVLPSYHEGLPRFLQEAAATGLPLVATDIEGCRMVVRTGINGLLVPPKDPMALAQALVTLVTDASIRARMGRTSREIAVQEFNEARITEQYLWLYKELGVF